MTSMVRVCRSVVRLLVFFAASLGASASAADFYVDSTADSADVTPGNGTCAAAGGACTLRAAIQEANALAGEDEIYLPEASYVLTGGPLTITASLRLYGQGQPVIDADAKSRAITISAGRAYVGVYMSRVTITNGLESFGAAGGIRVSANAGLELVYCRVSHNRSNQAGAGIYSEGYLRLYRSSVNDNETVQTINGGGQTANGGGIYSIGELHVEQSSVVRNVMIRGGGIANGGQAWISDSTISQNEALNIGGGILNYGGSSMWIERSTITENAIEGLGNDPDVGGGGIATYGYVWLYSTILAGNIDPHLLLTNPFAPDCAELTGTTFTGQFASSGHNLVGVGDGCGFTPSDLVGTEASPLDPGLEPLAPWAPGETELHALEPASPALHAGPRCQIPPFPGTPIPSCYDRDQRGYRRANGTPLETDIGAFEVDATPPQRVLSSP
ncbi:MAG: CSLREA domain-containing protein [Myxococcota bacterium]